MDFKITNEKVVDSCDCDNSILVMLDMEKRIIVLKCSKCKRKTKGYF